MINLETLEYELHQLKESNTLIIVEGKRDKAALQKLGFANIRILSKKPLYKIAEECAECSDKAAILTDLDPEGKRLYSKLNYYFSRMGVKVDNRFRNFLFRYTKLRQIEGLANYLERIRLYPQ